jgi:hypothetical protein
VDPVWYPLDVCWAAFVRGSIERWIWLFAVIAAFPVPPAFVQYFQHQLLSFIEAFAPTTPAFAVKSLVCVA